MTLPNDQDEHPLHFVAPLSFHVVENVATSITYFTLTVRRHTDFILEPSNNSNASN